MNRSDMYYWFESYGDVFRIKSWDSGGGTRLLDNNNNPIPLPKHTVQGDIRLIIEPTSSDKSYEFPPNFLSANYEGHDVESITFINNNGDADEGSVVNISSFPAGFTSYKMGDFIYKNDNVKDVIIHTGAFFINQNRVENFHIKVDNANLNIENHGIVIEFSTLASDLEHFILEGKTLQLPTDNNSSAIAVKAFVESANQTTRIDADCYIKIMKLNFQKGLSGEGRQFWGIEQYDFSSSNDQVVLGRSVSSEIYIKDYLSLSPLTLWQDLILTDKTCFNFKNKKQEAQIQLHSNNSSDNITEIELYPQTNKKVKDEFCFTNVGIYLTSGNEKIRFIGKPSSKDLYLIFANSAEEVKNIWKNAEINIGEGISEKNYWIKDSTGSDVVLDMESNILSTGAKYRNCQNQFFQTGASTQGELIFKTSDKDLEIPRWYFYNLAGLKVLNIEGSASHKVILKAQCFAECSNIKMIQIKGNVCLDTSITTKDQAPFYNSGTTECEVKIGDKTKTICSWLFAGMSNLALLNLENENSDLFEIADFSFAETQLKKISGCPRTLGIVSNLLFGYQEDISGVQTPRLSPSNNSCIETWYKDSSVNGEKILSDTGLRYAQGDNNEYMYEDYFYLLVFNIPNGSTKRWLLQFHQHRYSVSGVYNEFTLTKSFNNLNFLTKGNVIGISSNCFCKYITQGANFAPIYKTEETIIENIFLDSYESWNGSVFNGYVINFEFIQGIGKNIFSNIRLLVGDDQYSKNLSQQFDTQILFELDNIVSIGENGFQFYGNIEASLGNTGGSNQFFSYSISVDHLKEIYINSLQIRVIEEYIQNQIRLKSHNTSLSKEDIFLAWNNAFAEPQDSGTKKQLLDNTSDLFYDLYIKDKLIKNFIIANIKDTKELEEQELEQEIKQYYKNQQLINKQNDSNLVFNSVEEPIKLLTGCLAGNSSIENYLIDLNKCILGKNSIGPFNAYVQSDQTRALIFINDDYIQDTSILQKTGDHDIGYSSIHYIRLPITAFSKWFNYFNSDDEELTKGNESLGFWNNYANPQASTFFSGTQEVYSVYCNIKEDTTVVPHRIYPQQPKILYLPRLARNKDDETNGASYVANTKVFKEKYTKTTVDTYISPFLGILTLKDFEGSDLSKLEKVVINNTGRLGKFAFADCPVLKEAQLLNNWVQIGQWCFWNCKNLETLELGKGEGKKIIQDNAFFQCSKLWTVKIDMTANDWYQQVTFEKPDTASLFFYTSKIYTPAYYFRGENNQSLPWHGILTVKQKTDDEKDNEIINYDPAPFYSYTIEGLILTYPLKGVINERTFNDNSNYCYAKGIKSITIQKMLSKGAKEGDYSFFRQLMGLTFKIDKDYPRLTTISVPKKAFEHGDYIPSKYFSDFTNKQDVSESSLGDLTKNHASKITLKLFDNKIKGLHKDCFKNCEAKIRKLDGEPLTFENLRYSDNCGLEHFYTAKNKTNNFYIKNNPSYSNDNLIEITTDNIDKKSYIYYNNGRFNLLIGIENIAENASDPNSDYDYCNNSSKGFKDIFPWYTDKNTTVLVINQGCINNNNYEEISQEPKEYRWIQTLTLPFIGPCSDLDFIPPSMKYFTLFGLMRKPIATAVKYLYLGSQHKDIDYEAYFEPITSINSESLTKNWDLTPSNYPRRIFECHPIDNLFIGHEIASQVRNSLHFDSNHLKVSDSQPMNITLYLKTVPENLIIKSKDKDNTEEKVRIQNLYYKPKTATKEESPYEIEAHSLAADEIKNFYFEFDPCDENKVNIENCAFILNDDIYNPDSLINNYIYYNNSLQDWIQNRMHYNGSLANPVQYALALKTKPNGQEDYVIETQLELIASGSLQINNNYTLYFDASDYALEGNRQVASLILYKDNLKDDYPDIKDWEKVTLVLRDNKDTTKEVTSLNTKTEKGLIEVITGPAILQHGDKLNQYNPLGIEKTSLIISPEQKEEDTE